MSRCKHLHWGSGYRNGAWSKRCFGCYEYLPLGSATITPAVEIEIRAAELSDLAASHATPMEALGWFGRQPFESIDYSDAYLAGWLGSVINSHKDAP